MRTKFTLIIYNFYYDIISWFYFQNLKKFTCSLWVWMTLLTLLLVAFSIFVNFYHKFPSLVKSFTAFVNKNIFRRTDGGSSGETGVNKLLIRFLDTLGTICALTGLILGISSLFIDQYDFTFEPQGVLNDVSYKEYNYQIYLVELNFS